MKQWIKKVTSWIVVFAVVCSALVLLPAGQVEAAKAKKPSFEKSSYVVFYSEPYSGSSYIGRLGFRNVSEEAQITDIKISNNILVRRGAPTSRGISFDTNKVGTGTVSCKVKQDGKTYTLKCKVTVKKADPFKYVKVDGKKVYNKGMNNLCNYYTKKSSAKVSFQLNKGWKVKKLYTNDHNVETGVMSKNKTFKNGNKVSIKKGCYASVKLDVVNSKGEVYRFLICIRKSTASGGTNSSKGALPGQNGTEMTVTELGLVGIEGDPI